MNLANFKIIFALHAWLLFAIGLTFTQQPKAFADEPDPPEFEFVEPTSSSSNTEITDYSEIIKNADIQSTNDNAVYNKIDKELNSTVDNVVASIFDNLPHGLLEFLGGLEDTVGDFVSSKIPDVGKIIDIVFNSDLGGGETDLPSRQQSETLEGTLDSYAISESETDAVVREVLVETVSSTTLDESAQTNLKQTSVQVQKSVSESVDLGQDSQSRDVTQQILPLLILIYLALKQGSEVVQKRDWHGLVLLIVWPTIVALMLGNNGFLISQGIGALRSIDREFVKAMSTTQIASTNIQNALQDIQLTNAAREQIDSLINQCNSFNGTEYSDCLNNTIPQIDQIVEEAEAQNNGALAVLENYKDKIKGAILNIAAVGQIILAPQKIVLTTLVHALLIAVQLAFNMIIEIALLLHSLLAPIAVILTLIPTGQRYISIWLTWFAAIAAIQVCYTIIIGLAATAIVLSNAQLFSDITFLVLAAFFGPGLAYAMSKGGGTALYQSINSGVDKTISFGTEVVSKAVLLVL